MLKIVLKTYLMTALSVLLFAASAMAFPFAFVAILVLMMAPAVVAGLFPGAGSSE